MSKQQKVTATHVHIHIYIYIYIKINENEGFNWEEGVVNLPTMAPGNNTLH